jgi:hypothetical protein
MSPFIDDRGRLFGRVSVVDIIVVLLIVAVGAFAWGRFSGDETKMKDYRMEAFISQTRVPLVTESNIGDTVRDEGGAVLGRIEDVVVVESGVDVFPELSGSESTNKEVPVYGGYSTVFKDVTITIKGQAEASGTDVVVGGTPMRAGNPLVVVGPGYSPKTVIKSVSVAK